MEITFFGAAGEVTGSLHQVKTKNDRILLDCGLFQGRRKESEKKNKNFPFDPSKASSLVLSHAHIDHSGRIPLLTKNNFKGRILCTRTTKDACSHLLMDSAHIQEKDAEWVNKRRRRRGKDLVEPLYTEEDVQQVIPRFESAPLHERVEVADGITVLFRDADHQIPAPQIMEIVGESTEGVKYFLGVPAGFEFQAFPFHSAAGQDIVNIDRKFHCSTIIVHAYVF